MRPADPLDLAVARAFQRTEPVPAEAPQGLTRHQTIARSMVAKALGIGVIDPLTVEVAEIIYGFDQEAVEQPWPRLTEHRRQTYYDIAEAVLTRLGKHTARAA